VSLLVKSSQRSPAMKMLTLVSLFILVCTVLSAAPLNTTAWTKVLLISAHPDDIEACAGGLIASLTSQNIPVYYVILTNGDKGCSNPICQDWSPEQIAYTRQQEAINAAAVLRVPASQVTLLDYEDAMLTSYPEQQPRQDLVYHIRRIQPTVVMAWNPFPNFKLLPTVWSDLGFHPDHQQSGRLALDAQMDAGIKLLFPTAGPGWRIKEYYMWEFLEPTHYFIFNDIIMQQKTDALLAHKSQNSDNPQDVATWVKDLALRVGGNCGLQNQYAEGFVAYW